MNFIGFVLRIKKERGHFSSEILKYHFYERTSKVKVSQFSSGEVKSSLKKRPEVLQVPHTAIEGGQYYQELSVRQTHRLVLETVFEIF